MAQARQALRNVAAIFEAAPGQSSLLNATECMVALANISDYANVNKAYAAAFEGAGAFPARAAFQVAALPKAARVEIKCTGVMHDHDAAIMPPSIQSTLAALGPVLV